MTETKTKALKSSTTARRSPNKPAAMPKGYGALRGALVIRHEVDLTKPIYEQYLRLEGKERRRNTR